MLMVISPAKTLDLETAPPIETYSQPLFLDEAAELVEQLCMKTPEELSELMSMSARLGELNSQRFLEWQLPFSPANAKQAVLAFRGDVYAGLEADRFTAAEFDFAQQHLRILSGLYGLLRPLDLMQAYRLEMGTRLSTARGRNLYEFWGERITLALNEQLEAMGSRTLVNLASDEYFKVIQPRALSAEVVQPVFQDLKGGQYKIISFYAKKARGQMAAWAIRHRVAEVEQLKHFDVAGYRYAPEASTAWRWTFRRDVAA